MPNADESPLAGPVGDPHSIQSARRSIPHVTIENLPNEILLNIFRFLDGPQPSAAASILYDEPSFDITYSDVADIKTISYISKRWREAVLPLLFRHSRLTIPKSKSKEASKLGTEIQQFFEFTTRHQLRNAITTFTLICHDHNFEEDYKRDANNIISVFWESVFAVIDPVELLIVAPVEALSFFTACVINDEESWNFDCPCQYLRLERPPTARSVEDVVMENTTSQNMESVPKSTIPTITKQSSAIPDIPEQTTISSASMSNPFGGRNSTKALNAPVYADSAILFNRPWSKLMLNEGSFVKAYSTYEFWERKPPSILSHLLGTPTSKPLISPTIRDMEYIGIFPMETHFSNITRKCPRIDRLFVQLVPRNEILHDPVKMKQVESEDLWVERNRCYAILMRELFNTPPTGNFKYLKAFESGDSADKDAWSMAVEYVKRAGNGWKAAEDGVFVRDVPPEPEEGLEASAFEGSLVRWAFNGVSKLPISSRPLYDGFW